MFGLTQEVVLSPTASSYTMTQLAGSTEYNIRLQAIAGAQRSRHVDTVFTTSKDPFGFSFLSLLLENIFQGPGVFSCPEMMMKLT